MKSVGWFFVREKYCFDWKKTNRIKRIISQMNRAIEDEYRGSWARIALKAWTDSRGGHPGGSLSQSWKATGDAVTVADDELGCAHVTTNPAPLQLPSVQYLRAPAQATWLPVVISSDVWYSPLGPRRSGHGRTTTPTRNTIRALFRFQILEAKFA
jgi:hypothetical protein